ncbi:TRAP transporter substrate-binding protein [Roseibium sp.]|uniref:TRAP transporter substrate-binding protein n=1 Tax=Roseibium sp. TaxID=1936156 RepID=UPI003A98333A
MRPVSIARNLVAGALALSAVTTTSVAQEVTLKLHQFLPPVAVVPSKILKPWAENVEKASNGRIKVEHYDAMALGGRPPELYDQARDGVVDIIMTVTGYTPGRFIKTEVFELPFMMKGSVATSKAFWEYVESDLQNEEYKDVKMLGAWVHGPGVIHTADGVSKLEDMQGKKLRGPTRVINDLLKELGAVPVGMPLPSIPESLSKGVINGTVIPWEVTPAIKLTELVSNHTEFSGEEALYTATIIMAMNKDRYDSLPDDLKAIIDAESGMKLTTLAAEEMLAGDAPGRAIAEKNGNTIATLDQAEVDRWKEASKPVVARWVEQVKERGVDGNAVIEKAKTLIEKYGE